MRDKGSGRFYRNILAPNGPQYEWMHPVFRPMCVAWQPSRRVSEIISHHISRNSRANMALGRDLRFKM